MKRPVTGEPPPVIDYAPGDGGKPRPYLVWLIPLGVVAALVGIATVSFRPVAPPAPPPAAAPQP